MRFIGLFRKKKKEELEPAKEEPEPAKEESKTEEK